MNLVFFVPIKIFWRFKSKEGRIKLCKGLKSLKNLKFYGKKSLFINKFDHKIIKNKIITI